MPLIVHTSLRVNASEATHHGSEATTYIPIHTFEELAVSFIALGEGIGGNEDFPPIAIPAGTGLRRE